MLNIKYFKDNIEEISKKLETKGYVLDIDNFLSLESERKKIQIETENLQAQKNKSAKEIGVKKSRGEDVSYIFKEMSELSDKLKANEHKLSDLQQNIQNILDMMPNIPDESVPLGESEEDNVEIRKVGDIPNFTFTPKEHYDVAANLKNSKMDFDTASKLSRSRFVVLHGKLATLHRAITQFMLNTHIHEHGYEEVYVPYLVKSDTLYGTGQLPNLKDDLFATLSEDLWLIPTAEVSVTNLVKDKIINEKDLPLKYVCHSVCFRKEAGSYGKDTKGMIRQHQFDKVELVEISHPDKSKEALEKLTNSAEVILQKLKLPYRVTSLCTKDLGFSSSKTYDLEVWLPGQNRYREISSCSNMTCFQARRMQARFKNVETNKNEMVHTLNGSALAVGRTLVAILENYQDEYGRVHIPEVLQPFMNGEKIID